MRHGYLGIDIGSVAASLAVIDDEANLIHSRYLFHEGRLEDALKRLLSDVNPQHIRATGRTSHTPNLIEGACVVEPIAALIRSSRLAFPQARSILSVGGERFALILFDDQGNYRKLRSNSPCAAGTGSFLDQQAKRLGLSSSAELARRALENDGPLPAIASRCSVFAKTDLIHAQQEGYSLPAVCDGLCRGLAHSLVDTLFSGETAMEPAAFVGGVAHNRAVLRHLRDITGIDFSTDERAALHAAIGAALEARGRDGRQGQPGLRIRSAGGAREYYHPPLKARPSGYPDFNDHEHRLFVSSAAGETNPVEIDIYEDIRPGTTPVYMGIDIGSTSTKAVLSDGERRPLIGLYTRTAGAPVKAVQALFETMETIAAERRTSFDIGGVATTGSGRKFVGTLIKADLILDEITAHARAACQLDARTDTIIEIGGQDAKFTRLTNGAVSFSQMNTVCAAGTGSFIEEQANKLGVHLRDYARLACDTRAPLTSDRCTVFMERDINHFLAQGYTTREILAATLYAVRENYLHKVTGGVPMGRHVCFQGATAKNPALVSVFEEKLGRPILVSRFCHLTGALGAALTVQEERGGPSSFRGFRAFRNSVALRTEVCTLCRNSCRIIVAEIDGDETAFGFQCGRDYHSPGRRDRNISGFSPIRARREVFASRQANRPRSALRVGIPAALHLVEDLPLWTRFLRSIGMEVVSSEGMAECVREGKQLSRAEFCAPMAEFLGHVRRVSQKTDLIFIPHYLNEETIVSQTAPGLLAARQVRSWCYYTQYASTLARQFIERPERIISPLVRYAPFRTADALDDIHRCLAPHISMGRDEIGRAYDEANAWFSARKQALGEIYGKIRGMDIGTDVHVILFGRPYVIQSPSLGKGIADILGGLGVKCFTHDMLPAPEEERLKALFARMSWRFATSIMKAAMTTATMPGAYPVLVTSFKCSPDSFMLDYFKEIFEEAGKPYLILQIDEHDSNVGYETRIEAGVRAFRNHFHSGFSARTSEPRRRFLGGFPFQASERPEFIPLLDRMDKRKTLYLPDFDPLTLPLLVTVLRREGLETRLLDEREDMIRRSMRFNTGQCIPTSIVAESYMHAIREDEPGASVLWIPDSAWACNITMMPLYIKSLLRRNGFETAGVIAGDFSFMDISPLATVNTFCAYLFGGTLRKLACRLRPYENRKGQTDAAVHEAQEIFSRAIAEGRSYEQTVRDVSGLFLSLPVTREKRPKVAVFGDIYIRDNDVLNQNLIRSIEEAGGEAVVTPYVDYVKIIAESYFQRMLARHQLLNFARLRTILPFLERMERRIMRPLEPLLGETASFRNAPAAERLWGLGFRLEQEGESFDNALKIFHLLDRHELRLLVQANPAFCCPSLVTEAMGPAIEQATGVPLLSITYDGTGSLKNNLIAPYLVH